MKNITKFQMLTHAFRSVIILFYRTATHIVLPELLAPWETIISKDHLIKIDKYYELINELNRNGYMVNLFAVDVGDRGLSTTSLIQLVKKNWPV